MENKDKKFRNFIIGVLTMWILALLSLFYLETAYGYQQEFEGGWEDFENLGFSDFENNEADEVGEDVEQIGKVRLMHKFLDGDIVKISVLAEEMLTPVLGLAFHLKYDSEKVKFLKYEPGDFLERGGNPFYLVQNDEEKKMLVFGETLRRKDDFPLGEGGIVDLYFQIFEKDSMTFQFEQGVVSTMDTVRQDIDKIEWEDMELDKNGKRIAMKSEIEMENEDIDVGMIVKTSTDRVNLSENSIIILGMGAVILSLAVWILIDRKKNKK